MTDLDQVAEANRRLIDSLEADIDSLSVELAEFQSDRNLSFGIRDQIRERKRMIEWVDQVVGSARRVRSVDGRVERRKAANAAPPPVRQ